MAYEADVIVVGAGLSGLVAACELADAGKRVIIVDQEPEQNLGGQAFWSFGGLFLVNSPEQRCLGIRDSYDLALDDWMQTAGTTGRASGPRPMWPLRPARSDRGCGPMGCGGFASSSGPNAAATVPSGKAIPCPASM